MAKSQNITWHDAHGAPPADVVLEAAAVVRVGVVAGARAAVAVRNRVAATLSHS